MKRPDEIPAINQSADYRCLSLHLPNTLEALPSLAEAVEIFGTEAGWADALMMQMNLVLEELIVNAINYGYPDRRAGNIDVTLETNAGQICIRITDDGNAFDPFAVPPPDLSLPMEERPEGGLGIHLVRCYMDTYLYSHTDKLNQIVLCKWL